MAETHTPDAARSNLLRDIIPQEVSLQQTEADCQKLRRLSEPSDFQGLIQLGYHVGCMLFSSWLVSTALNTNNTVFLWTAMTLHGFFLSFLFMGLHECVHHTAFKRFNSSQLQLTRSTWLNSVVGWWYGLLCGRLPRYYTFFHFPHHRYTGDLKNDPGIDLLSHC